MNWKKCLTVLLSLTATLPAFALDKPGFYMAAGMAFDATTAEDFGYVAEDAPPSATLTDAGRTKLRGSLTVGYYYPLSPKYALMVEAGKDAGSDAGFTTATLLSGNEYSSQFDREWQFKRNWFFSIKPALRLSDTTLAYLSLSHHQASVSGRSNLYIDCKDGACSGTSSFSGGGNLSGTGIGLGMQTTMEKMWFLRVEVESIRFNQFSASKFDPDGGNVLNAQTLHPKSTVGRFMVGYRF